MKIVFIISIIWFMSFNLSANDNFIKVCNQTLLSEQSSLLLMVKKKKPEIYEEALNSAKTEAKTFCSCLINNLNQQIEIIGLDKDDSFEQISFAFKTGYKVYIDHDVSRILGSASLPCITK